MTYESTKAGLPTDASRDRDLWDPSRVSGVLVRYSTGMRGVQSSNGRLYRQGYSCKQEASGVV
jgi:hypothetical protein